MSPLARLLMLAGIAFGATAAVLLSSGIFWPVTVSFRLATPAAAPTPPMPAPPGEPAAAVVAATATETGREVIDANVPAPPALEVSRNMPTWERQIELATNDPAKNDTERSRAVFGLLPGLPEEALGEAAERAVKRLPDADYATTALPVVINPQTHSRAMSVLFADLMERPDAITLPALLQIARNSGHAFAPSARDNLQLLLNADFANDWPRWEAEIQRALVEPKR